MSEPEMDDMCVCGKDYGAHMGSYCPDGSGRHFIDAAYRADLAAAEERGADKWRGYFNELCDVLFPDSVGKNRMIGWKDVIAQAKAAEERGRRCGFTPEEARSLWQAGSRTPGSVASEPLDSALAKLLPIAESDGARRHYHGIGCDWVRDSAPRRCEHCDNPEPHSHTVRDLRDSGKEG